MFPEDTGTYTVIAKNLGGEARTSCLVTVEGVIPVTQQPVEGAAPMKPRFTQPLKNVDVMEGSRARLDSVIVARPEPEVGTNHRFEIPCYIL